MVRDLIVYNKKDKNNYSPLNIRAVVFSLYGVLVYYHVPVNNRYYDSVMFPLAKAYNEFLADSSKAFTSLLFKPACTAVEQIIYMYNSDSVNLKWCMNEETSLMSRSAPRFMRLIEVARLDLDEIKFNDLVRLPVLSGSKSNCSESTLSKFGISDKNNKSFKDLLNSGRIKVFGNGDGVWNFKTYIDRSEGINSVEFHKNDWYNCSGATNYQSNTYPLNPVLFDRFNNIKSDTNKALGKYNESIFSFNRKVALELKHLDNLLGFYSDLVRYIKISGGFYKNSSNDVYLGYSGPKSIKNGLASKINSFYLDKSSNLGVSFDSNSNLATSRNASFFTDIREVNFLYNIVVINMVGFLSKCVINFLTDCDKCYFNKNSDKDEVKYELLESLLQSVIPNGRRNLLLSSFAVRSFSPPIQLYSFPEERAINKLSDFCGQKLEVLHANSVPTEDIFGENFKSHTIKDTSAVPYRLSVLFCTVINLYGNVINGKEEINYLKQYNLGYMKKCEYIDNAYKVLSKIFIND